MANSKINHIVKNYANLVLDCKDFVEFFLNDTKIYADENKKIEFYISVLLFLASYEKYSKQSFAATKKYYLKKLIFLMKHATLSMNTFNGLCGIGYAFHFSRLEDEKWGISIENQFDSIYFKILKNYKKELSDTIDKFGLCESNYDLIDGYAAIISFLFNSGIYNKDFKLFKSITMDFISMLSISSWVIPPSNMILPYLAKEFPYGATNFSLSHGMAGPLSVLDLLQLNGLNFSNETSIVNKLINLYKENIIKNNSNIWWPTRKAAKIKRTCEFPRASWCYGTPGIANVLYNASIVTGDTDLKKIAMKSIFTLCKKSVSDLYIDSMTICHGLSGLILCIQNINKKLKSNELKEKQDFYVDLLLKNAESDYKYMYHNYDYLTPFKPNSRKTYQNDISFLTGSTGVIMTLMAVSSDIEFNWLKILSLY